MERPALLRKLDRLDPATSTEPGMPGPVCILMSQQTRDRLCNDITRVLASRLFGWQRDPVDAIVLDQLARWCAGKALANVLR